MLDYKVLLSFWTDEKLLSVEEAKIA